MIQIKVKYFASLREQYGDSIEKTLDKPISIATLWKSLHAGADLPPHILMTVNSQYCKPDQLITDGDEIAFFPPVTGG